MRKSLWQVAVLLLLSGALFASTSTLTGNITDEQGNPLNGTLTMRLPVPAQDTTTNTAVAPSLVTYRVVNGAISAGPPLYDVATLQPQGLYYIARAYDQTGALQFYGNYVVTGASFNLGAAVPTTVTTSNISYLNPASQNGNNVFSGVNSFTNSNTFTGTTIFSGTVTITLNNPGIFTNTQGNQYLQSLLNSCSSATEYNTVQVGNNSTDALSGCVAVPSSATVHQQNAVAGYVNTLQTGGSGGAVAGYFQARILSGSSNGPAIWGINPIVQDVIGPTGEQMIGVEDDMNVFGSPARAWGILLTGNTTGTMPSGAGNAAGLDIRAPGYANCLNNCTTARQWVAGINIEDSSASSAAINIGATSSGNSVNSLPVILNPRDSGGTLRPITIQAQPIGSSASTLSINAAIQKLNIQDKGQCTMSSGTCSAQALNNTYTSAPICIVTWTGAGTLAGSIKVASSTTTVTPSSSTGTDSAVVNWICIGN